MNFQIEEKDNYTLIKTKVEKLDTNVAPELKSHLVVMGNGGIKNIIIDLSETRYCDSSGLSAILVANRTCKTNNGTLVITGLQESVKKLISISQLDTILNIAADLQESTKMITQ